MIMRLISLNVCVCSGRKIVVIITTVHDFSTVMCWCRNRPPSSCEYNFPPGRTIGIPIENGYRDELNVSVD